MQLSGPLKLSKFSTVNPEGEVARPASEVAAPHFSGEDSPWRPWEEMQAEIESPWPQQSALLRGDRHHAQPSPQRGRSQRQGDDVESETVDPDEEDDDNWGPWKEEKEDEPLMKQLIAPAALADHGGQTKFQVRGVVANHK